MSLIECFKIPSDVNKVDALIDLPKEMYDSIKCVELWKNWAWISLTYMHVSFWPQIYTSRQS